MAAVNDQKLAMLAAYIRRLKDENRKLREENASLRGRITKEQAAINRADMEVFRLVRHNAKPSDCLHIVIGV